MNAQIATAVCGAHETATRALAAADPDRDALIPRDLFVAVAHQRLFYILCGADPTPGEGGAAATGKTILRVFSAMVAP